jgi:hypothetical protein
VILDPAKLEETAKRIYEYVRSEVNRGVTSQKQATVPWECCAADAKERWLIVAQWHMDQIATHAMAVEMRNVQWESYDKT